VVALVKVPSDQSSEDAPVLPESGVGVGVGVFDAGVRFAGRGPMIWGVQAPRARDKKQSEAKNEFGKAKFKFRKILDFPTLILYRLFDRKDQVKKQGF